MIQVPPPQDEGLTASSAQGSLGKHSEPRQPRHSVFIHSSIIRSFSRYLSSGGRAPTVLHVLAPSPLPPPPPFTHAFLTSSLPALPLTHLSSHSLLFLKQASSAFRLCGCSLHLGLSCSKYPQIWPPHILKISTQCHLLSKAFPSHLHI